jgi:exopolysaccharide production protein ExoY
MKDIHFDGTARDLPLMDPPAVIYVRSLKRGIDIVIALLALPILIPMIAVFCLIIRRDGAPGLYGQERIGRYGQPFTCWKLRTMVPNAEQVLGAMCAQDPKIAREWNTRQKLANDPRITGFGAFLRASSFDELPQIWNVLVGDMSFVGPRPFMANQEAAYLAAGGSAYFRMRPGITGPWQVEGRGTTRFSDRVAYDAAYYDQISLGYDLSLIFRTVPVVCRKTGH